MLFKVSDCFVHLFCNKRIGWSKLFWLHFEGRSRWDILQYIWTWLYSLLAKYYKVLQQVSSLPFQNSTMLSFCKKSFLNVYMVFYFFNQFISCYKNSDTSFSRQIHLIDLWKVYAYALTDQFKYYLSICSWIYSNSKKIMNKSIQSSSTMSSS